MRFVPGSSTSTSTYENIYTYILIIGKHCWLQIISIISDKGIPQSN